MQHRRIFHPTDFSDGSDVAFAHALKIAISAQAKLDILHVAKDMQDVHREDFPSIRDTLVRWKALPEGATREDVGRLGLQIHKTVSQHADPAQGILKYLDDRPADLVVLATHQREGLDRWLHKKIAGKVSQWSHATTLFVPHGVGGFVDRRDGSVRLNRVMIPVDRQPKPDPAIVAVADFCSALSCETLEATCLHVGYEVDAPKFATPVRDGWQWTTVYRHGEPETAILEAAQQTRPDLIAMVTEGPHGFLDAVRGSTTEQVLARTNCPVLAVPAGNAMHS